MAEKIHILPLADHEYAVDVTEGTTTTHHRVIITEQLIDDLGIVDLDERRLVDESIRFLLEREPATSIYEEFPLDTVVSHFDDYLDEMRTRLAG